MTIQGEAKQYCNSYSSLLSQAYIKHTVKSHGNCGKLIHLSNTNLSNASSETEANRKTRALDSFASYIARVSSNRSDSDRTRNEKQSSLWRRERKRGAQRFDRHRLTSIGLFVLPEMSESCARCRGLINLQQRIAPTAGRVRQQRWRSLSSLREHLQSDPTAIWTHAGGIQFHYSSLQGIRRSLKNNYPQWDPRAQTS